MSLERPAGGASWDPEFKQVFPAHGGFNVSVPGDQLRDDESPDILNLVENKSLLTVDNGVKKFGQAVVGSPQKAFEFKQRNGTSFLVGVTTQTVYYFSSNLQLWLLPSDNTSTTLNGAVASGNSFVLTSATGFTNGKLIGITLNDGSQLQTTITGVVTNTITTADPLPAGKTAANGAAVVRAPTLSGTVSKPVAGVTVADNDWFVFTNGVDAVQYFDGVAVQPLAGLSGINVTTCAWLTVWNRHLVLFAPTESGSAKPQRVRRSANTDVTNWTTLNSGVDDLTETSDFILSATVIGPFLVIYREKSIMRVRYTGDANQLFFYEYTLQKVGVLGGNAIAELSASHDDEQSSTGGLNFIFSSAGVFRYLAGFDLQSIGENIFHYALGQSGNLNNSQRSKVWATYVEQLSELWLFYAQTGDTTPRNCLRLDVTKKTWRFRKFAQGFLGASFFTTVTGLTWAQDTLRWIDKQYSWDTQTSQANAPLIVLACPDNNQFYAYDFLAVTDDGTVIPWYYTSKDYAIPNKQITFDGISVFGVGQGVVIEISLDKGKNWTTVGTMNFGVSFTRQQLDKQITGNLFRIRISGTDPSFQMSWYEVRWQEASEW